MGKYEGLFCFSVCKSNEPSENTFVRYGVKLFSFSNNIEKMDLQSYLKKYSAVSSRFVDDFFSLYDIETTQSDFVINLETVVKWLKSKKSKLTETLRNSYTKNIDYKITKGESTGGRPSQTIMLTSDCFKRLCMLSRTKKAEEVRSYFIEIEKHLDKYKNYIIEALNKQIDVLKNNQKPIANPKSGVIYVLKTDFGIEDVYKIGKTQSFRKRIATHNTSHVDNVDIVLVYESHDINSVEQCLKLALKGKQYRKRKEFYQVDVDLIKELVSGCESLMLKAKASPKKLIHKQTGGYYIMIGG